jgi:hypothetical protein
VHSARQAHPLRIRSCTSETTRCSETPTQTFRLSYSHGISNRSSDAGRLQSRAGSLCQPVDSPLGAATNLGSLFNDPIEQEPGGDFFSHVLEQSGDWIARMLDSDTATPIGMFLPLFPQSLGLDLRPHGQDYAIPTAELDFQTTTVNPAFLTSTPFGQSSPSFIQDAFDQYHISPSPISLPPSEGSTPPAPTKPAKKRMYQPVMEISNERVAENLTRPYLAITISGAKGS